MVEEQGRQKVYRINSKLLKDELEAYELTTESELTLQLLEHTLGSKLLSKVEVRRAIETALTLQAAKCAPREAEERTPIALSLWALETGLSTVVPSSIPRLGRPVARSREDVNAMALDKHEKALAANVYFHRMKR